METNRGQREGDARTIVTALSDSCYDKRRQWFRTSEVSTQICTPHATHHSYQIYCSSLLLFLASNKHHRDSNSNPQSAVVETETEQCANVVRSVCVWDCISSGTNVLTHTHTRTHIRSYCIRGVRFPLQVGELTAFLWCFLSLSWMKLAWRVDNVFDQL